MKPSGFVEDIISKYIKDEELHGLLITHSRHVAEKALAVADACGLGARIDRQFVYDAAMLHDIGVVECDAPSIYCHGTLPYICHGIAGAAILEREGIGDEYRRVCARHTGSGLTAREIEERNLPLPPADYLPETLEEKVICYADKFFSKSSTPDREKPVERVRASMARHGEEALRRFGELEKLFTPAENHGAGPGEAQTNK